MTAIEFIDLTTDLENVVNKIPEFWGSIQNDISDNKINMFEINSYAHLENKISHLGVNDKNYLKKRWFLWKCAQCDEYLFSNNQNVRLNSNPKSKQYDVEFNDTINLRFDIKSTVIPQMFRENINEVILNPKIMVDFFYNNQSKGIRNFIQNRLFIVHHSLIEQKREIEIRCNWQVKEEIFKRYSNTINTNSNFIKFNTIIADVIFIIENSDGTFYTKISSL